MKGNSLLPERKGKKAMHLYPVKAICISGCLSAPFLKHRQKWEQNLIINTKQL